MRLNNLLPAVAVGCLSVGAAFAQSPGNVQLYGPTATPGASRIDPNALAYSINLGLKSKVDVANGVLSNPTVTGGSFTGSTFVGATFPGTNLVSPTINGGTITGATITGGNLGQPNGPAQLDGTGALNGTPLTNSTITAGEISQALATIYTGSPPRTIQKRAQDTVNPLDFGALCNGTHDDTAALQAALTAATNGTSFPLGAVVIVPAGTCVTSSALAATLSSTGDLHIRGYGQTVSIIKVSGATDGIDLTLNATGSGAIMTGALGLSDFAIVTPAIKNASAPTAGIKITDVSGHAGDAAVYTTLRNIQVGTGSLGNGAFFSGVDIEQTSSVLMDSVHVLGSLNADFTGNGVLINGGDVTHPNTGYVLTNMVASRGLGVAINLTGNLQGISITNPESISPADGIDFLTSAADNAGTLTIVGGILNNRNYGVHTLNVGAVSISGGSQIFPLGTPTGSSPYWAAYIDQTNASSIIGIHVVNPVPTNGIFLGTSGVTTGNTIVGNRINGATTGISVQNESASTQEVIVSGNTVTATSTPFTSGDFAGAGPSPFLVLSGNCFSSGASCTSPPSATGCGSTGTAVTTFSTDRVGAVIEGPGATGCTLTWAQPKSKVPFCTVTSPTGSVLTSYATTVTALTLVNPTARGAQFTWSCGEQ